MSGKGSAPRPRSVDAETFSENWDRIFARDRKTIQPQPWDHYNDLPAPGAYEEQDDDQPDQ